MAAIVDNIKSWIKTCPVLRNYGFTDNPKVNVDAMGDQTIQYTITVAPTQPTLAEFIDGTRVKQITFEFRSLEELNDDKLTNLENNEFYYKLENWVYNQQDSLPYSWDKVECVSQGYIYSEEGSNKAIYSITFRIEYREEQ